MGALKRYIWQPIVDLVNKDLFELAGYTAYAALLSFFPFIILLLTIAGLLGATDVGEVMIREMYALMPREVVSQVSPIVDEIVNSHKGGILTFSMLVILWAASSGIEALRTSLNRVYGIEETRSFLSRKLQNIVLIILSVIALMIVGSAMIVFPVIFHYVVDHCPRQLADLCGAITADMIDFRYIISCGVVFVTFFAVYWLLPNTRLRIRDCLPGAALSSLVWLGVAHVFSFYIKDVTTYNVLYGSLAGIIITLLFLHVSALILLYGAEFNLAICKKSIPEN